MNLFQQVQKEYDQLLKPKKQTAPAHRKRRSSFGNATKMELAALTADDHGGFFFELFLVRAII